jgi:hypothetical protein
LSRPLGFLPGRAQISFEIGQIPEKPESIDDTLGGAR